MSIAVRSDLHSPCARTMALGARSRRDGLHSVHRERRRSGRTQEAELEDGTHCSGLDSSPSFAGGRGEFLGPRNVRG